MLLESKTRLINKNGPPNSTNREFTLLEYILSNLRIDRNAY